MKIKKENPSKVIIIPRPPVAANAQCAPAAEAACAAPEAAAPEAPAPAPAPGFVEPGAGPMNNQVQGPAEGLAGVPKEE